MSLQTKFGPNASVFEGELYNVARIAEALLRELHQRKGRVSLALIQQFAATTGVDTTSFHDGPRLKPLTAIAVVEEFLSSPQARNFEPGARYFWGYKID